jgi:hypothetical protein
MKKSEGDVEILRRRDGGRTAEFPLNRRKLMTLAYVKHQTQPCSMKRPLFYKLPRLFISSKQEPRDRRGFADKQY